MPLTANLEAEFGAGGFSIGGALNVSATDLGSVAIDPVAIDEGALTGAATALADVDVGSITGALETTLGAVAVAVDGIPGFDDLIGPLNTALALADPILSGTAGSAIGAVEGVVVDDGLSGLAALEARFAAVDAIRTDPSVDALLGLLGGVLPGDVDVGGTIGDIGSRAAALRGLVRLVGGLMSVESRSRELRELADMVATMLRPGDFAAAVARLEVLAGATGLDDLLVGIDPDDADLVEIVAPPISDFTRALRTSADVVVRGMAFGDATLAHTDVAALFARFDDGLALLDETAAAPIRSLAEEVRAWLQPLLDVPLPDPAASADAFADRVVAAIDDLVSGIDRLDPARVAGPLTSGLASALGVVGEIGTAAEEAAALVRNALGTVRDLVAAVDLAPITVAIRTVLDPVADALAVVTGVVDDAQAGIETVSGTVVDALEDVKASLGTASGAISDALGRLQAAVDALGLEQLQETLEDLIDPVATFLESADLGPYFDTANEVIDTAADVVDAVPFSLLPDDVLQGVADAIEPIKAIDFQRDVADVLDRRLTEIVDALDTDVLAEIEAAYNEVIAFLDGIDPSEPLLTFEQEAFDPLIAALRSIDPEQILRPIEDAIAPIREAIADFHLLDDVFAPIDDALDTVQEQLAAYDPVQFVAPIEEQVDTLRTGVTDTLRTDEWSDWLDIAESTARSVLARLDLNVLVEPLESAFDGLVDEVAGDGDGRGDSVLGTVVATLLESTGAAVRVDAFGTVLGWVRGTDGAEVVRSRLSAAADGIDAVLAAVAGVDLAAIVAAVQPVHRSIATALAAHPADSRLRLALDAELSVSSPQDLFADLIDSRDRYEAALRDVSGELRRLAGSGHSQVTAVSVALGDALRPLTAVLDRLRALLVKVGLDPTGRPPRELVAELLALFRPSRILAPLTAAVDALRGKLEALVVDGVLGPVRGAVTDLESALAAIDIGFIRTDLAAIYGDVIGAIDQLRPATVMGDLVTEVEDLRSTLGDFDPLGPVREAVDAWTGAIDEVDTQFRPTVLFAPVVSVYDEVVTALGSLDVRNLLQPVLDGLDSLVIQLGDGLDRTATALGRLQDALPDVDDIGSGGGAGVSVGASVGIG